MILNRIFLSFSHIYLLCLYHLTNSYKTQIKSYRLEFDAQYSPPATIPKNPKDLVYSVPLNQLTSQPIIVRIRDQLNNIITPQGDPFVTVSTLDVLEWKGIGADNWKLTGGRLCQKTYFGQAWPERYNRQKYKKICGSKPDLTVIIMKFVKNMIILDWLIHEHPKGFVPSNSRFLRVSIPDMKLSADSNAFNITVPAGNLVISKQPPKTITANTDFNISAEIHDLDDILVTDGLDSILYIELTVPYEYKEFYNHMGKDMLIYHTDIRLGGDDVVIHQGTNDLVIRKQASGGRVHFTNVRILDVTLKFKLNLTMYMSKDPWLRSPNCRTCYVDILKKDISMNNHVKFRPMTKTLLRLTPAISLTREFDVLQQTLSRLFLSSPFKKKGQGQKGQLLITRNFPLPGPMYLEARDKYGNRIYSGSHSESTVEIETYPKGVHISGDFNMHITEGYGILEGSICQIVNSVHLIMYSQLDPSIVVNSTNFKVIGDVHVAHFDHFQYSGAGLHIEPHINSFIRFAAQDLNAGFIHGLLKHLRMRIIVDTVDTNNDVAQTITVYSKFRQRAAQEPSKRFRAIIMPSNKKISSAMIRDVNNDQVTMLSLSQKEMKFMQYHFFNRICWNWDEITLFFFVACKERSWTNLIILRMDDEPIPKAFHKLSSRQNITFTGHVVIPLFNPEQWQKGMLRDKMNELENLKTRIIVCLVNSIYQHIVLSEAYHFGLSSHNGYQWVFLSDYARAFPITSLCGVSVKCSEAFKGSLLFTGTYNNSNFHSADWYRTLDYFLSSDRASLLGLAPYYPDGDVGSFMALGYDAIWLFAEALHRIISRQLTVTGWRITEELRKVEIEGLTGVLKLDYWGQRTGFIGTIKVINSEPNSRIQLIRFVKYISQGVQVEFKYGTAPKYFDSASNLSLTMIPLPSSEIYNLREFISYSGGINEEDNLWLEDKSEVWPSTRIRRFEKVIPQFTCKYSCGKRVSIEDINLYDRGRCIAMDTCHCFSGYYGKNCEHVMCICLFGQCEEPFKCTCSTGWAGKKCDKPICTDPCIHGKCTKPETCKCSSSVWVGGTCNIHIAKIIVPLLLILAVLVYLGRTGAFWWKKHLQHKAALSDLSWLVNWTDVSKVDPETTSKMSCMIELYSWNREKWYVKNFNSTTVDKHDEKIRFEMVELVTLHHQNFITYGGACLTYPNVCLLLEPAHKGSLEDILVNDSIELGWDFRFSFMKDICNGMNYLHTKTDLHSHGRLKSSNCLLDNRWSIRLSGFGASNIRCGQYLIVDDPEDSDVYSENQMSLMWTAPELLEKASCLNDVQKGTQQGDVYSYGIIVSEIATRDVPFCYERCFLSIYSILDLILDVDNPALGKDCEVWNSIGGNFNHIRPQITNEQLPDSKSVKKKFRNMLDDIWHEEPDSRLSFQKIIPLLAKIHPTKGELMDNLIHLLESYSSNLEQVVVERTNDLEIEKTTIENIINQMLPKQVVESLKNGEKVHPEIFDNVTVFYSDIVGFTTIANKSQPMDVVDLLNTLYGKFDGILAQHDVYKVETIGDAYVVSSGIPERNGNLHAGEIATATINMVCTIMTVPIPHLPEDKLLLRIGINSGSVIAGIVGLKMPRYTLFGETMQIAASLEASSKPLHIHVSENTIKILDELGGYVYKLRKESEVICNQTINTYWLMGKKGYKMVLPNIED